MSQDLTINEEQTYFTPEQVKTLQLMGAGGNNTSPNDLRVFFHQVQKTGLDPFAHQIYLIERQGKQTIQTGIDGYRLVARRATDRSGGTLGYGEQLWCGTDGVWREAWLSHEPPAAAKCVVVRNGEPFPAIALFTEYVALRRDGQPNQIWATKPALMLMKCAEALALRKAFPADLSGIYTTDEMGQANNPVQQQGVSRKPVTDDTVQVEVVDEPPKKKRGRPRKHPVEQVKPEPATTAEGEVDVSTGEILETTPVEGSPEDQQEQLDRVRYFQGILNIPEEAMQKSAIWTFGGNAPDGDWTGWPARSLEVVWRKFKETAVERGLVEEGE